MGARILLMKRKLCSFEKNDKRLLLHSGENEFIDEQCFKELTFEYLTVILKIDFREGRGVLFV